MDRPISQDAQTGFTLVELMIGLAIVAILLLLAVPHYAEFSDNSRTRNVAEHFAQGVRQAQLEAVKRNERVKFMVTTAGWEVRDVETNTLLVAEGTIEKLAASAPAVTPEPAGAVELTFTGLGRVLAKNPPGDTDPLTRIKVRPTGSGTRALGVAISVPGGAIRVCDPDPHFTYAGSTDPLACPLPW